MGKYSNYFYSAMLVVNIIFACYFINRWVSAKPTAQILPSDLVTENSSVKAEILKLTGSPDNKQFVIALTSSRASICADNKLADFFRTTHSKRPDLELYGLFSKNTSDQDISNFRNNLGLVFEAVKMDSELDDYWEHISQKYETPTIIILKNRNGLFASQNISELRKALEIY